MTTHITELHQGIKTFNAIGAEVFQIWLDAELHLHVDDPEAIALLLRQGANPTREAADDYYNEFVANREG